MSHMRSSASESHRPRRRGLGRLSLAAVAVLALTVAPQALSPGDGAAWAKSKGSSYSKSSSSSSGSWGRSASSSPWGSGSATSSGGYSKPSLSSGAAQPAARTAPAPAASSGGYSKPVLAAPAPPPAAAPVAASSGGYAKPALPGAPAQPALAAPAAASGGYAKPAGAVTGTAPAGSATDQAITRQESSAALKQYQQQKQPVPVAAAPVAAAPAPRQGAMVSSRTPTTTGSGAVMGEGLYRATPARTSSWVGPALAGAVVGATVGAVAGAMASDHPASATSHATASAAPTAAATAATATAALNRDPAQMVEERWQHLVAARRSSLYQDMAGNREFTREDVLAARQRYYGKSQGYPPEYHGSPLFDARSPGALDPGFLLGQLFKGNNKYPRGDAELWYSLLGVAGVAEFMSDLEQVAETTRDQSLQPRVLAVKSSVNDLRNAGTRRPDAATVMQRMNIPPEVVFPMAVLIGAQEKSPVRFATGHLQGGYHLFCQGGPDFKGLRGLTPLLDTRCQETQGSQENLHAFVDGQADAILVQADVADAWLRTEKGRKLGPYQVTLMQEPFWLLVNEKGSIDALDDLKPDVHTLLVGQAQSGSTASWNNLLHHGQKGKLGKKLARVPTRHGEPLDAARQVAEDKTLALFLVMAPNSSLMTQIARQYGAKLKLIPIEAASFEKVLDREQNPVYRTCTIPGGSYPELQEGWFITRVETLCVDAVVALSEKWVAKYGESDENAFLNGAKQAITDFQKRQHVD